MQTQRALQFTPEELEPGHPLFGATAELFTPEELEHPLFGARAFWSGRDIGPDFDDRLERRLAWILGGSAALRGGPGVLRGSAAEGPAISVRVALGRWVQGRISILRQRRALASSKVYLFGLYFQAVFGRSY